MKINPGDRSPHVATKAGVAVMLAAALSPVLTADAAPSFPAPHADRGEWTLTVTCTEGDLPLVTPRTKSTGFILQLACLDPRTGQRAGYEELNTQQNSPLAAGQYAVRILAESDGVHSPSLGVTFPMGNEYVNAILSGVNANTVTYDVTDNTLPTPTVTDPSAIWGSELPDG